VCCIPGYLPGTSVLVDEALYSSKQQERSCDHRLFVVTHSFELWFQTLWYPLFITSAFDDIVVAVMSLAGAAADTARVVSTH
jgi:hypothetical protein